METITARRLNIRDDRPVYCHVGDRGTGYCEHDHDFIEITVIRSGQGTHVHSGGEERLRAGHIIVVRPGAAHGYRSCHDMSMADICIDPQLFKVELTFLLGHTACARLLWQEPMKAPHGLFAFAVPTHVLRACDGPIQRLSDLYKRDAPCRLLQVAALIELVAILSPHLPDSQESAKPAFSSSLARRAIELMEGDIRSSWTAEGLAWRMKVSPEHLSRCIRGTTGLPPIAYLNRIRCERAAALLMGTDRSIADIGSDVGFDDPRYFSRRFRKAFGVSPLQFRRRSRA